MYEVRETNDIDGLIEMFNENGLEPTNKNHEGIVKCWDIKDKDGERIAGLRLEKRGNEFVITGVAVVERYRHKNFGSVLVDKSVEEAKKMGAERIIIVTKAPGFFSKKGFIEIEPEKLSETINCVECPQYNKVCFPLAMYLEIK